MKKVQVLGTGCPKCIKLYDIVKKTAEENSIECDLTKVSDINEIIGFGVMMTPALVIDGEVKVTGKIPKPDEIVKWLKA